MTSAPRTGPTDSRHERQEHYVTATGLLLALQGVEAREDELRNAARVLTRLQPPPTPQGSAS